jgi:uncharacterized protein involved in outer membrane biogenesis
MRKWIISGLVVLVLVIAATAALLNVNYLIARNKGYLIAHAEGALGRKISTSEVEATVLTGLGVRLKDFVMSDDPAYSSGDFIRARNLQINFKFWPLLNREVQIKRVILNEPAIRIVRSPQGSFNFSSIGKTAGENKERPENKAPDLRHQKAREVAFLVSLVDIADGDLRYIDQRDGGDLRVRDIDLKLEDPDPSRPVSIKLAAALYSDKQNFNLAGKVGPLGGSDKITAAPVAGEIDIDPLNVSRLNEALPKLRNSIFKDLDVSGIFRVKNLSFQGKLNNLELNGEIDGSNGALRYANSFHKPIGVPLNFNAAARYTGEKLTISGGRLNLHTLELASAGDIQFGESTVLNVSVHSQPASLEGWGTIVPVLARYQMSGMVNLRATVRGKLGKGNAPLVDGILQLKNASARPPEFPQAITNLDAKIRLSGHRADIQDMSLTLGKSNIRVAAAVEKFSPLTFTYKMSTPEIWPADYRLALPAERKADVIRELQSEGRFTAAGDSLIYQGRLTSAAGTLYQLDYQGLDLNLSVADKVAQVRSLRGKILKGAVQLEGEYSFKEAAPRFSADAKVQGIDIKELYAYLDPKAEHDIRGRLNGDTKLSGNGKSWEAIKSNLHGQGTAEVLQGTLLNFNIAEGTLSGITGIPGLTNVISPALRKKYPETFTANDTEFKELKADFDLGQGRIKIKNLRMSAAEFMVHGSGWVDFSRRIDFPATVLFSRAVSADLTQSAREVKYLLNKHGQLEIPMTLSGRLPNVKPRPDVKFLGQVAQRGFFQKGVEELQNRYLGRNESPIPEEGAPDENKRRKRNSTEEAIRRSLESLFKR